VNAVNENQRRKFSADFKAQAVELVVFTIPKRLRIYFRYDRRLLGELCRAAWDVVRTVLQSVSGRPDAAAGMIGAIQTFGDLIHWHPHIHALVAEGVLPVSPTGQRGFGGRAQT